MSFDIPEAGYNFYTKRGEAENCIRDLKNDLYLDRLSCHKYLANCFRMLMSCFAYVIMQEIRFMLEGTELEKAQSNKKLKASIQEILDKRIIIGESKVIKDLKKQIENLPDDIEVFIRNAQNQFGTIMEVGKVNKDVYSFFGKSIDCVIIEPIEGYPVFMHSAFKFLSFGSWKKKKSLIDEIIRVIKNDISDIQYLLILCNNLINPHQGGVSIIQ